MALALLSWPQIPDWVWIVAVLWIVGHALEKKLMVTNTYLEKLLGIRADMYELRAEVSRIETKVREIRDKYWAEMR